MYHSTIRENLFDNGHNDYDGQDYAQRQKEHEENERIMKEESGKLAAPNYNRNYIGKKKGQFTKDKWFKQLMLYTEEMKIHFTAVLSF